VTIVERRAERTYWPIRFRHRLFLFCALLSFVTLLGVFFYLERKQESLYIAGIRHQSQLLFKQIVLTRKWIADHGGIFVEKMPWVTPNPYLERSTIGVGEKEYVKRNPATVTRELAAYAKKQGSYWFNITSLEPVNPGNVADDFERAALLAFEGGGEKESSTITRIDGERFFRYMAPLYSEEECLECHARHGYRVGDIRGGISVTFPMEQFYAAQRRERVVMALFAAVVGILMAGVLYFSVNRSLVVPITGLRDFVVRWRRETDGGSLAAGGENAFCAPMGAAGTGGMAGIHPGDELHDLYREFCRLHEIITGSQKELEGKVRQATEELSRVNEELLLARDRYKEASDRKSEFIAAISHELRTPLTSIKGAVRYLAERIGNTGDGEIPQREELVPFIEIIGRNMDSFIKFVEDTLDLEKIESGKVDYHMADVDLTNLVTEAVEDQKAAEDVKGVDFRLDLPARLIVAADEGRIRQVLLNLLQNAVRYSPEGGEIGVQCGTDNGWATVRVKDRLPPERSKSVFERFHKGEKGGSGLGLTIAKGIIESHGGKIGAETNGEGGSTFTFRIPLGKGTAAGAG
jgi:signal transduction histidine kinase